MYITQRRAQVAGVAGLDWAMRMTKAVHDAGVPASLWFGGPGTVPGSVAWSVIVDSFADWAGHTARLLEDSEYRRLSAEGREVLNGLEYDRMLELVHGTIDAPTEVGGYVGVVEATVHPDRSIDAAAFAVEVADAWSSTTGLQVVVAVDAAGDMSAMHWLASYPDAASVDEANGKIAVSAEYAAVLAKGAGLFTGGQRGTRDARPDRAADDRPARGGHVWPAGAACLQPGRVLDTARRTWWHGRRSQVAWVRRDVWGSGPESGVVSPFGRPPESSPEVA